MWGWEEGMQDDTGAMAWSCREVAEPDELWFGCAVLDLVDELLYKEQGRWWDNVRLLAARREDMTEVTVMSWWEEQETGQEKEEK